MHSCLLPPVDKFPIQISQSFPPAAPSFSDTQIPQSFSYNDCPSPRTSLRRSKRFTHCVTSRPRADDAQHAAICIFPFIITNANCPPLPSAVHRPPSTVPHRVLVHDARSARAPSPAGSDDAIATRRAVRFRCQASSPIILDPGMNSTVDTSSSPSPVQVYLAVRRCCITRWSPTRTVTTIRVHVFMVITRTRDATRLHWSMGSDSTRLSV